jgi:hypothetical protein
MDGSGNDSICGTIPVFARSNWEKSQETSVKIVSGMRVNTGPLKYGIELLTTRPHCPVKSYHIYMHAWKEGRTYPKTFLMIREDVQMHGQEAPHL